MEKTSFKRRYALVALVGYPVLVAAGRALQCTSAPRRSSRQIIVSSDDAGMCQSVNIGTIEAMNKGIVSSASIMTCCPAFEEFAAFAVSHPQFDYGVHLTLTCDLREQPWGPITGDSSSSLVDGDGLFCLWPPETLDIDEAESELRSQIDRAKSFGINITHLDHHMWVLFSSPSLLALYVRLGLEYDIPIRFGRTAPPQIERYGKGMSAFYLEQAEVIARSGLPLLDRIESENYSLRPEMKRTHFLNVIRALPVGVTELALHCAVTGQPISPPDVEKRQADLDFFVTKEAVDCLLEGDIEQVKWGDL